MKALMLTPDAGHLDRRIAQEAGSLAGRGWKVDILPAVDPALAFEDRLSPGVRLLASIRSPRVDQPLKPLLRSVKRQLARTIPPIARMIEATQYRARDIADEITISNLEGLVRSEPYDVVFAHDIPVLPLGASLKERWACALICDLHEVFPDQTAWIISERGRDYWRSIEARYLPKADGIICVNDAVADYVQTNYDPPAPRTVIHNSVPFVEQESLGGPTIRSYYPIPDGKRVMVWAGTLRSQTNLQVLIRGFARARLDDWAMAIFGAGPLQAELEEIVRGEELEDSVFLGRRAPQRELVPLCSSADLGLLPYQPESFNLLNATPNKLYEYIQARLPIATSRLPMIEQIINVHGNGGYVDFSTAESTAAGLRDFVSRLLGEISSEALEAAAADFSWDRDEERLLQIVETALGSAQRR